MTGSPDRQRQAAVVVVQAVARDQLQLVGIAQARRRHRVERIEGPGREARREPDRAGDEADEHVGDDGARRQRRRVVGHALRDEAADVVVGRSLQRIAAVGRARRLVPVGQAQAGRARHLDQAAEAVDRQAGVDADLLDLAGGGRDVLDLEAGQRAAAGQERERARQAAAVIGLLVAEVLRVEQHAGGVRRALRARLRIQRIGLGRLDAHFLLLGLRGLTGTVVPVGVVVPVGRVMPVRPQ